MSSVHVNLILGEKESLGDKLESVFFKINEEDDFS